MYEQAQLKVVLDLAPSGTKDVSSQGSLLSITSADEDQVVVQGRLISVAGAEPGTEGLSTLTASFPGRNGNASEAWEAQYTVSANRTANAVKRIYDVQVISTLGHRSTVTTLHKTQGSTYMVVFSVEFADSPQRGRHPPRSPCP